MTQPPLQGVWKENDYVQLGISHPQVILSAAGATQVSSCPHFGYFSCNIIAHGLCNPFTFLRFTTSLFLAVVLSFLAEMR